MLLKLFIFSPHFNLFVQKADPGLVPFYVDLYTILFKFVLHFYHEQEAEVSPETSVNIYQATQHYIAKCIYL